MSKPKAAAKQRRSSGKRVKAAPPAAKPALAAAHKSDPEPALVSVPNAGQFQAGNPYRWKPGESGNPAGGRKGPRLSDLIHAALQAPMPKDRLTALQDLIDAGATIGETIAWALALNASEGSLDAITVIADRTEGAPDQTVHVHDLTTDDLAAARAKAQAWESERFPAGAPALAETPAMPATQAAPEAPSGQP